MEPSSLSEQMSADQQSFTPLTGVDVFINLSITANDHHVDVLGTAKVKVKLPVSHGRITVHMLRQTSQPLILGTTFLRHQDLGLDFSQSKYKWTKTKVRCRKSVTFPPRTETIITASVPSTFCMGLQGICTQDNHVLKVNILVSKAVVVVARFHTVPVKVCNPTAESIVLPRRTVLAEFTLLDSDYKCCKLVWTNSNLLNEDREQLQKVLYDNKDVFVTSDNPGLGLTHVVEHNIVLKPGAKPKYQRPYRLSPDKREVLRHQLDEVLAQGVIAPVNETEDLPITSPIVLVTKRNPEQGLFLGSNKLLYPYTVFVVISVT
ncbi:uncharacterized protein LOC135464824 [Liolophura sinensis]|uniref:uncharacterized protein LOC135464824 n=1 Tax=Liolophura sinensis TaxID=3198878 RepID=UPI0031587D1A